MSAASMGHYTPSTEAVLSAYTNERWDLTRTRDEAKAEAGRWLEQTLANAEAPMIDWLINIHYPFDMTFDNPPPVNMTKLALRWKERDGWDCTDDEAIDLIRGEAIPNPL